MLGDMITDDFDIDGSTSGSQLVFQSNFVLSGVTMDTAVHLQVAGGVLLPVQTNQQQNNKSTNSCKYTTYIDL